MATARTCALFAQVGGSQTCSCVICAHLFCFHEGDDPVYLSLVHSSVPVP
jgi:hypothetical protein